MDQLRRVSIAFALVAFVLALLTGAVLFFVIEPPILVRLFVALSAIATLGDGAIAVGPAPTILPIEFDNHN